MIIGKGDQISDPKKVFMDMLIGNLENEVLRGKSNLMLKHEILTTLGKNFHLTFTQANNLIENNVGDLR
jgi:hypothetical protein